MDPGYPPVDLDVQHPIRLPTGGISNNENAQLPTSLESDVRRLERQEYSFSDVSGPASSEEPPLGNSRARSGNKSLKERCRKMKKKCKRRMRRRMEDIQNVVRSVHAMVQDIYKKVNVRGASGRA